MLKTLTLQRPRVGLDIGSRHVRMAQLKPNEGGWSVDRCVSFRRRRPGGLPDEGEAVRIAQTLQRQGMNGSNIIAAVPNAMLRASLLEIPRGDAKDPGAYVAEEFGRIHGGPDQAFELAAWNVTVEKRGAATELMVVGCELESSESFLNVLESAGLDVIQLDARCLAANRCLGAAAFGDGVQAIIDFDDDEATLCLTVNGQVVYQRAMSCGGLDRLRDQFSEEHDQPAVSEYLWTRGPAAWHELGDVGPVKALRALVHSYAASAAEDVRAASGYVGQHFGDAIERIWPIGPGAELPDLFNVLSDRGLEVAQPSAAKLLKKHIGSAVAIGLAAPELSPDDLNAQSEDISTSEPDKSSEREVASATTAPSQPATVSSEAA